MLTASSLAWKTSLRKVRTLWHCSRLRSGALPMIDRVISVRQSTVAISGLHCQGAGYGQFEHKAGQPDCKIQEAGGTVREIDVWAESPRLSPLWLFAISSSACHGLLIITVITPLPTKPSATTKSRELEAGERGNYRDMQMRQRDVAGARCKIHCRALWSAGTDTVMMLPLVVVGCTSKQSVSQCEAAPLPPPAWIMQPPPDWQTPLNGLFHPQREADHCVKQLEGTQKYINEQCR